MTGQRPYRTLFTGTLRQDSFVSVGGTDDPYTTVDSPFCRDGCNRPTLRGTGLAGALISTLRRCMKHRSEDVPDYISGANNGEKASTWRFFNAYPVTTNPEYAYRQHVSIDSQTGASVEGALFNVETLPPGTEWHFLLEVNTLRETEAAELAREALSYWAAGFCMIGREVARGMGWLTLTNLKEFSLTTEHVDSWPNSTVSDNYIDYINRQFGDVVRHVEPASSPPPGTTVITGNIRAGVRDDQYGIDSVSIGGHATEEISSAWDEHFLKADGLDPEAARASFDPDMAIVTVKTDDNPRPYLPGSSIRGTARHFMESLLEESDDYTREKHETLFGNLSESAKLLICDAFLEDDDFTLAWMFQHAEDEFTASAYDSSLFNRVTLIEGNLQWKMLLEDLDPIILALLFEQAENHQIGLGGGQWQGHGWPAWKVNRQVTHD